jgi:hypothetical protein
LRPAAGQRLVAGAAAAVATRRLRAALVPGAGPLARLVKDPARWTRTNHRGEPVSLLAGPATAAGLLVGALLGGSTARGAVAAAVATAGGAAFGLVDDLREEGTPAKGLRGHLGSLARGRLTTGGLKIVGIGASGLLAAAIVTPRRGRGGGPQHPAAWAVDVATSGALIAATANLINLFDLRPGRALKVAGMVAGPLAVAGGAGAGLAAGVVGAALGALPADLAELDMLGDGGANAVGALLGTAVVVAAPRGARLALLAGAVALTVASERVSFTRVIAGTPALRQLDAWGRRPGGPTGAS